MEIALSKAKARLSELATRADRGEEIVLTRRGKSAVRIVADERRPTAEEKRTVLERYRGVAKGKPEWEGVTAATAADFLYDEFGLPA